ncbi:LOW QUALITY PROTEIN: TBC1 domain family member 31 [Phycodurus eques]|uniref:LOW QUALITY PROTEIN: TBC1 domain family member 31 n=1 Tax=Phycodurus eques TaxID=693459 RepID=UPI002ACD7D2F|nr:LOW QUALITY PROTEIN: TBC1 domain family member 31 [Phycodurus eques]
MDVTDIGNREEGKLKHRKPSSGKGVLLTVVRTAQQTKVRFLHAAFDTTGEYFLAGDHHGNIYAFDISRNRFHLVQKTGQACTALALSFHRSAEFLVALVDNTIKCFDQDTKQMVSWMRGHEGAVSSISIHSSGRYAVTTSSDTAQLWDLDTFQRKRKLNIHQSVGIQKVFFLPLSNNILSCFSDDSIFAWDSNTLVCEYQLPVPDSGPRLFYKAFAVTQDGKSLAAGGRSNLLHLWCLESKTLVKVIQMPTQVRTVRQLEFLSDSFDGGSNQTLGVLSQDGIMRFINIHTSKLLFHVGSHNTVINTVTISPTGRHVVAILDNGSISVYSVQSLTEDLNKVAVVSDSAANQAPSNLKVKFDMIQRPATHTGPPKRVKIRAPTAGPAVEDKENQLPGGLNKTRLLGLLKTFGEYPGKYRMFVWRSLLCLPENYAAHSSLTDKGLHSAYLTLHEKYPIKSQKLQRGLQRVLSALSHWASIFGEVEYLPLLAFPFVKLFQNNPMLCFEVVATVLVNWCQHWFEYFPNPPLNILSMAENILAHHDKELLQHLVDCGITSQLYVWPLLETLFSEVLTRDEWLRLFDNVFSNHPSFLLMACVAYLTCCREPLLLCSQKEDFEYFFHHRNNLDMEAMIKDAYRLMIKTPADIQPMRLLSDVTPLTKGQYPVFNHYPEFIVEYQNREREKIRQQEMEYLEERQEVMTLRKDLVAQQSEEDAYYVQQELLQKAEEQRRNILAQEEEKLTQQRKNLAAMKRELKAKELQMLDANKRRLLQHQQDLQVSQIRRLDQEITRKMDVREQETAAAVQDLDIRQMELEVQRRQLEQELCKEQLRIERQVEDVRMKRSDGEKRNMQGLEGFPAAEARQLGADRNWQRDAAAERLQHADGELEKRRRTLAGGDRLMHIPRNVAGHEWDEVVYQTGHIVKQQQSRPAADTSYSRPGFNISRVRKATAKPATPKQAGSNAMVCLNSSSPTESTGTNFSLDRGRAHLDSQERQLIREMNCLRLKLAARAIEDSFASRWSLDTPHAASY